MKDAETRIVYDEGEHISSLVSSEGWKLAKRALSSRILEIGNILSISKTENAVQELGARQIAIQLVLDWLRDIEGAANQHKSNKDIYADLQREEYVRVVQTEE
jgi:hypothetical protein